MSLSASGEGEFPHLQAGGGGQVQSSSSVSKEASVPSHGSMPSQASIQNRLLLTTSRLIFGSIASIVSSSIPRRPLSKLMQISGFNMLTLPVKVKLMTGAMPETVQGKLTFGRPKFDVQFEFTDRGAPSLLNFAWKQQVLPSVFTVPSRTKVAL